MWRFTCDDGAGGLDRGAGGVDRDAQRAEPVPVGGRDLDQGDVEREQARPEELGHLREEDRKVVGTPVLDRLAEVRPDEDGVHPEAPGDGGGGVGGVPLGVELDDLHDPELACARRHGLDEAAGRGGDAVDEDPVAGLDGVDGLGGRNFTHAVDLPWRAKIPEGGATEAHF